MKTKPRPKITGGVLRSGQEVQRVTANAGNRRFVRGMRVRMPKVSDADAQAWLAAVWANGGRVSAATASAVSAFCVSAKANGYWSKLARINLFCGSQLRACLVPLKVGTGSALEGNTGFVEADYSESVGLTSANGKFLNTGVRVSDFDPASTHLAVYNRGSSVVASMIYHIGAQSAGYTWKMHAPYVDLKMYADFYNGVATDGRTVSAAAFTGAFGFLIGTRTAPNAGAAYRAGVSVGTNSTAITTLPTGSNHIGVFTCLSDADAPIGFSSNPLAAYSVGAGLTQAEVTAYSADMQTFQTALGRAV